MTLPFFYPEYYYPIMSKRALFLVHHFRSSYMYIVPPYPYFPPFHVFCISVVYTYYRKIHPFSAQHIFPVVAYTPRRGRRNLAQGRASVTSGTLGLRTTHVTAPRKGKRKNWRSRSKIIAKGSTCPFRARILRRSLTQGAARCARSTLG